MIPTLLFVSGAAFANPTTAASCDPAADAGQRLQTMSCAVPVAPAHANQAEAEVQHDASDSQSHPYVGMWVTGDGRIRQELLSDGRYDEARGPRQSAYVGRYEVTGDKIFYWDDSGFTADGEFVDINTLHHGGMVFFRGL